MMKHVEALYHSLMARARSNQFLKEKAAKKAAKYWREVTFHLDMVWVIKKAIAAAKQGKGK